MTEVMSHIPETSPVPIEDTKSETAVRPSEIQAEVIESPVPNISEDKNDVSTKTELSTQDQEKIEELRQILGTDSKTKENASENKKNMPSLEEILGKIDEELLDSIDGLNQEAKLILMDSLNTFLTLQAIQNKQVLEIIKACNSKEELEEKMEQEEDGPLKLFVKFIRSLIKFAAKTVAEVQPEINKQ
ncbi:hypothetical protein AUK11_00840 [bacterium CG2_30_37_16]|nr:MAG: hypothetical protein AUK11_00840 [bacterium CG2_30_37_16]PIP31203.1 MAG: hypothetical protein COX25_00665 [bacterium (Candidatus Howlettbacteria) CG23_combo_of_CG06-09_8_20_14_all_37_9]PIY00405.1 MAG: hypothetical protein COZ22_00350 [bacterium (Candidatus Howlettbacteria) CG_4_10_14_3_um_filter_37_10]PJB06458.1 MAG: hypothetical protein CO123_02175 [bacterium (Candidatus Howlettbacteria) CG_4_9_14_3_um_filter_37_10]